jgi:hypothetical protein
MKSLRSLFGIVNFYRCFITGEAKIIHPPGQWATGWLEGQVQLEHVPDAKTGAPRPTVDADFSMVADVSNMHVGAVLQQWSACGLQPRSFYSKKPDPVS